MGVLKLPFPIEAHWRACQQCAHVRDWGAIQACTAPQVAERGRAVPCSMARRHDGACGPDARHLLWPEVTTA